LELVRGDIYRQPGFVAVANAALSCCPEVERPARSTRLPGPHGVAGDRSGVADGLGNHHRRAWDSAWVEARERRGQHGLGGGPGTHVDTEQA
jgi:hypothetical protein